MSEKSQKNIKNTCKTNIYKFRANSKKAQQVNPSPLKSAQVPWTYFLLIVRHITTKEIMYDLSLFKQIQKEVPVEQQIVSSTQPAVNVKANSMISLVSPVTIQQLIQVQLIASGQDNIPIRLILPQSSIAPQNSQLAQLLQTVVTQPAVGAQPGNQPLLQAVVDANVAPNHIVEWRFFVRGDGDCKFLIQDIMAFHLRQWWIYWAASGD